MKNLKNCKDKSPMLKAKAMKSMETIKVKMSKAKNEQETANLIELEKKQKQLFQKMEQTELEKE